MVAAPALADESMFDSLGRAAGLISPEPNPPDFVKQSRSTTPSEPVSIFAAPQEPHSKIKTADELKAMDSALQRAGDRATGKRRKRPEKSTP